MSRAGVPAASKMFVGDCPNVVVAIRGRLYVEAHRRRADLDLESLGFAVGHLSKRDNSAGPRYFYLKILKEGYVSETMLTPIKRFEFVILKNFVML